MLYISCSVFHKESKKIGFVFLWIFLQFSTDFRNFSQTPSSMQDPLYNQVPGQFWSLTDMPIVCRLAPKKIEIIAIGF
jgi:hypothetical protein